VLPSGQFTLESCLLAFHSTIGIEVKVRPRLVSRINSSDIVLFKQREFGEALGLCLGEVCGPEEERDRYQVDDVDISVPIDVRGAIVARAVDR
jgi:hypothetical protein